MTKRLLYSLIFTVLFLSPTWSSLWAQEERDTTIRDTTINPVDTTRTDTAATTTDEPIVIKKVDSTFFNHSPRRAAIRSAIIPGWGQAYNRQYWKIPIVYAALGTTAGIFVYNLKNYRDFRFAYQAKYKAANAPPGSPPGTVPDSTDYWRMKPQFQNPNWDLVNLRLYRNEFRKNIDYSVLVFILFWGLNVADAAAAAHLRTFDVSPDLTFQIKPGRSQMGNTHGLSLVLAFK